MSDVPADRAVRQPRRGPRQRVGLEPLQFLHHGRRSDITQVRTTASANPSLLAFGQIANRRLDPGPGTSAPAVLALDAAPGQVAALSQLPAFVLALPAGVIADRTSKQRLMIWSHLTAVGVVAAVAAAAVLDALSMWVLHRSR